MKIGDFNNTMLKGKKNPDILSLIALCKCHIYCAALPTIAPLIIEVTGT